MKTDKIKVSRNVEVPGQADVERSTTVSFRAAENATEMLELCGNDVNKAMSYFNSGRWAEFRTKVSNALANKTPQQRAVDKMIAAFKSINPTLTDAQVRTIVLQMPNMQTAVGNMAEVLPAEIDETYFDNRKAEGENGTETEGAEAATAETATK